MNTSSGWWRTINISIFILIIFPLFCFYGEYLRQQRIARNVHLKEFVLTAARASSINARNTEDNGAPGEINPGDTLSRPIIYQRLGKT
jgi:hypothetical protein